MITIPSSPADLRALALCDETLDCLRRFGGDLAPVFLLFSLPLAVAVVLLLDAAAAGDAVAVRELAGWVVAAEILHWLGGAAVQRRTAALGFGGAVGTWRSMIRSYLWLRFLWQPMFAGPVALERSGRGRPWRTLWPLYRSSSGLILRFYGWSVSLAAVAAAQVVAFQYFCTEVVLPSLAGADTTALGAVLGSRLWWLGLGVFAALGFELYLLVAGVVIHATLTARWTGADLVDRCRLAYGNP
ncbi:MAG: hypothetical protein LIP77_11380 [Planctomycetes bacterium]|nr:hypothetical protein [Planctomycetota bacterium]